MSQFQLESTKLMQRKASRVEASSLPLVYFTLTVTHTREGLRETPLPTTSSKDSVLVTEQNILASDELIGQI